MNKKIFIRVLAVMAVALLCFTGNALAIDFDNLGGVSPTIRKALRTISNDGTAATGFSAREYDNGYNHTTVLSVNGTFGAIVGGTDLGLGLLAYNYPAGAVIVESAYMSVALQQTEGNVTADTPEIGLGTVVASGAVTALNGTATFESILTGQAAADCDGTATVKTAIPTAAVPLVIETAGGHGVYVNIADGWAASGDAALGLVGTIVLNWRFMN